MKDNQKVILVLGSNGFLGSNFRVYLQNYLSFHPSSPNYEIHCWNKQQFDLRCPERCLEAFKTLRPAVIINCCGIIGSSEMNKEKNQFEMLNDNVMINANLLDCCKTLECLETIVFFSSYRLLEIPFGYYTKEASTTSMSIVPADHKGGNIGYLLSKQIMHEQIRLFSDSYSKCKVWCLVLPNIFGSYDTFAEGGRIVPSFITKLFSSTSEVINIPCSGDIEVNLIFAEDVVKITAKLLQGDSPFFKEKIATATDLLVLNPFGTFTLSELMSTLLQIKKKIAIDDDVQEQKITFLNENENHSEAKRGTKNHRQQQQQQFVPLADDFKFYDSQKALEKTITYYLGLCV